MMLFLLVGDNTHEVKDLIYYIEFAGSLVHLVTDLQTSRHIINSTSLHLDALITILPVKLHRKTTRVKRFGGFEIARETRNIRPGLPILFFSKFNPMYYPGANKLTFDFGFIPKPPRFYEVMVALQTLENLKEVAVDNHSACNRKYQGLSGGGITTLDR